MSHCSFYIQENIVVVFQLTISEKYINKTKMPHVNYLRHYYNYYFALLRLFKYVILIYGSYEFLNEMFIYKRFEKQMLRIKY